LSSTVRLPLAQPRLAAPRGLPPPHAPGGPHPGRGWKRAVEPGGTTHSWLHLASGSRPQLHRQLHVRSRPAAPRLAGLRMEPELEPLLEPCQTGPIYAQTCDLIPCRFYITSNI
jgi:hypothetical protein